MFRVQSLPGHEPTADAPLSEVVEQTHRDKWADCRGGGKGLRSQARIAVEGLALSRKLSPDTMTLADVDEDAIRSAVATWKAQGIAPATITKRLNCLSVMGVSVAGQRPRKERALKWWLRPDQEDRAIGWLDRQIASNGDLAKGTSKQALSTLRFVIRWTTKTGLRIEETLRLTPDDFGSDLTEITVPGLKTIMSQATLPLGSAAQDALREWLRDVNVRPGIPIISIGYAGLYEAWRSLSAAMGWPKTATMKALRRSAARYLHTEMGLPLDMVRHYLRHENINTTMMYLHLTGGYGTDEMRRFLK